MTVAEAYAICQEIARREAKNFYYAFRVLPAHKRDGICAVYAFMRKADDLADDESMSIPERRVAMAAWLDAWRAARAGGATDDPVFIALADAQRRFDISDKLLEELVQGTCMDLADPGAATGDGQAVDLGEDLQGYRTFEDLYRYCYLVASVVGLVCIKIFGYTNPDAELLAEKTGIAFQLTNILRDVKEDVERGRIYLPQSLLQEFGVTNEDVVAMSEGQAMRPQDRAMLGALTAQAWGYYRASEQLLPMIDPDSRPALWVLVEIYSDLLERIDRRGCDVFSTRVSVPTGKKLAILAQGFVKSLGAKRA
ncbi:phytoene synthase [Granulicella rosea]|uniref:Phytoene synthase n=1 Tax=Granulicella rosea TaxID=474952 RepID=A0A239GXQ8_9BACT|nr:phytoene/squalene synthase family protein [Granulicella rosea]SNS73989.1 phytoene synthase [Granulicella rosea]